MTRKEMITYCVEDLIRRGITTEEKKEFQIKCFLNSSPRMSWMQCKDWYEAVKANQ